VHAKFSTARCTRSSPLKCGGGSPRLPAWQSGKLTGEFCSAQSVYIGTVDASRCTSKALRRRPRTLRATGQQTTKLAHCFRWRSDGDFAEALVFRRVTRGRDITPVKSGVARAALVFEEDTPCARSAWSVGGFGAFVVLPRAVLPKQESDNSIQSSRAHCLFCR